MSWVPLLGYVWGGVFLANAVPHVVGGTMGRSFQGPLRKADLPVFSAAFRPLQWRP